MSLDHLDAIDVEVSSQLNDQFLKGNFLLLLSRGYFLDRGFGGSIDFLEYFINFL